MEYIIYWIKLILMAPLKLNGAVFCLMALLVFVFLPAQSRRKLSDILDYRYDLIALYAVGLFIALGSIYLAYPNYLDHVESTITTLGSVLQRGGELYPAPDTYPYHGLLYGPALAEIQVIFSGLGVPMIMASKLPGLLAFALSILILLNLNKNPLSRGYLLYLLPFGLFLFWNRAEPFFLLLVSLSLFISHNRIDSKHIPILLGFLAGAASALKLHGAIYVFSAYLAVAITAGISFPSLLLFSLSTALSFFLLHLPINDSVASFIDYLKLASHHGLSLAMWRDNFIYFVFLISPLFILWQNTRLNRDTKINLLLIIGIEFFVTILGAKPGAGTHHLLPFIPINAFIINKIYSTDTSKGAPFVKIIYSSLIIPSLITASLLLAKPMLNNWGQYSNAKQELGQLNEAYPGLVMGLTDESGYPYVFLRVLLNSQQIDYPAYMDLQFSGIGDDTFSANLLGCKITSILLPNNGTPFTMNNYYTDKPLLSSKVRQAFMDKYTISESGKYFSVYTCRL